MSPQFLELLHYPDLTFLISHDESSHNGKDNRGAHTIAHACLNELGLVYEFVIQKFNSKCRLHRVSSARMPIRPIQSK